MAKMQILLSFGLEKKTSFVWVLKRSIKILGNFIHPSFESYCKIFKGSPHWSYTVILCKESYCHYLKVIREQWDVRVFGGWYFSYLHYLSCNKASKHLVLWSISWIWQGMIIWALFWPDNCVTLPLTSFYTAFRSRPKPNLNNKQQELSCGFF